MSLLTRCPACTTLYKVVPDQLRISQGWVKCGQCGEIFDASQHLIQASAAVEQVLADPPTQASGQISDHAVMAGVPEDTVKSSSCTEDQSHLATEAEAEAEAEALTPVVPNPLSMPEAVTNAGLDSREGTALESSNALYSLAPVTSEVTTLDATQDVSDLPPSTEIAIAADVGMAPMSFLRAIDHESIWHLRIVKGALVLMSVLFSVGLLAQWVYQERDRLASAQPALKPVLDALCAPLNCAVQAVHRIESIAIDAAAFNKLGVDSYRLSFVVKNLASQVLALPGIELTLTDSQDQVVLRRVLSPTDLFATSDALAPGSEWPVTVLVRVQADTTAARVVGYRLLAFYP